MSAMVALFAVRQNAKQREASYRPELVLTRTVFTASKHPARAASFAELWVVERDEGSSESDVAPAAFALPLRNIGLGAAKGLTLKWSFALADLVATVNARAQKALVPAYFSLEKGMLSLKSDRLGTSMSMWKNQQEASIDYALPASFDPAGVRVQVPHAYMQLISALIYFSSKGHDPEPFPGVPELGLELDYHDIGGGRHRASFVIELHLVMMHGDGEGFRGWFQSRKVA